MVTIHGHIWKHGEKFIEISTNIPVIGSLIREIDVEMCRNLRKQTDFLLSKTNTWHNYRPLCVGGVNA